MFQEDEAIYILL